MESPPPSPLRCLVLGGSGHVGAEVCRCLARDGHRVAFTYRKNEAFAHRLRQELPGAIAIGAELTRFDEAARAVEEGARALGGLDALVQCAGTAGEPSLYKEGADKFMSIGEADWRAMMDLTAQSTFAAAQAACRAMPAEGCGARPPCGTPACAPARPAPAWPIRP